MGHTLHYTKTNSCGKMKRSSVLFRLLYIICTLMVTVTSMLDTSLPCNFHRIGDGVCVCNETYCDTLDTPQMVCGEYILVSSSKSGKRFSITRTKFESVTSSIVLNRRLEIDETQKFQKLIGFGGALTDSTSLVMASMNKKIRECVYSSYASKSLGAAYEIIRIPLGASDFRYFFFIFFRKMNGTKSTSRW